MRAGQQQSAAGNATGVDKHRVTSAGAAEDLAVLTLDKGGLILDCSRAAETLFKYRRSEMVWRHVSMLLPQLEKVDLMQDGRPNPALRFLCRVGRLFRTVAQDGENFSSELFLTVLSNEGSNGLLMIVRPTATPAVDEGQLQLH